MENIENIFPNNIDDLKSKYDYDKNNYEEYDEISIELSSRCNLGIEYLLEDIEELIKQLKNYNGDKKQEAKQYIIIMTESHKQYKSIMNQVTDEGADSLILIRHFKGLIKDYNNVKEIKDICKKNLEAILNQRVQKLIRFDKQIINSFNIIKDLNKYFHF